MFRFTSAVIVVCSLAVAGCGGNEATNEGESSASSATTAGAGVSNITNLQYTDRTVGGGTEATSGRQVTVHYTGWLYDAAAPNNRGKKFDSSLDRGQPFVFPLGAGRVIRGWDEGVAGMRIGGVRTLVIPSDLGYGDRGAPPDIPPKATLVFDVELLDVR